MIHKARHFNDLILVIGVISAKQFCNLLNRLQFIDRCVRGRLLRAYKMLYGIILVYVYS